MCGASTTISGCFDEQKPTTGTPGRGRRKAPYAAAPVHVCGRLDVWVM